VRYLQPSVPLALVVGLIAAGCGVSLGNTPLVVPTHKVAAQPDISSRTAAPVFSGASLTWVSNDQGWALGTTPNCAGQRCVEIMGTTDGGIEWSPVSELHDCLLEAAPVGCPAGVMQLSEIRFATSELGYAYASDGGPFALTTDGGQSWTVQTGRQASAIEVGSGTAVRVSFSESGCPGPCDWSIDAAALGGSNWQTLYTPPTWGNHGNVVLLRQGASDVYVSFLGDPASGAGDQQAQIVVSTDDGWYWTVRADPCAGSAGQRYVDRGLTSAPNGIVVALCVRRDGLGPEAVAVSSDCGASFGPLAMIPESDHSQFTEIAATTAQHLFAAIPGAILIASTNGGQSWHTAVAVSGQLPADATTSTFLGFESPEVGRWVGAPGTMWGTTDGGATWSVSRF
jgi:photosystem II stability/assembly factor-like uncharacterized protein